MKRCSVKSWFMVGVLVSISGLVLGGYYNTSFDTADAVQNWTVVSGNWSLDAGAGVYRATTTSSTAMSIYNGPLTWGGVGTDLKDYTVSADVIVNGGDSALVARYAGKGDYYFYRLHEATGTLQIYVVGNGTRQLAQVPIADGPVTAPFTLSLTVKGDQLTGSIYVNGVLRGTVTAVDSLHKKGTVGFRAYSSSATFSSLHVTSTRGAINIAPADGASGVSTESMLRWATVEDLWGNVIANVGAHYLYVSRGGSDPNVYLEATIPTNGAEASYDQLELSRDMRYFWQIEEAMHDGLGGITAPGDPNNIMGDLWSFETIKSIPVVQEQPEDVFVRTGDRAEITIVVATLSPEHYQWFKVVDGGDDLAVNGDSPVLVIDPVSAADVGFYYCVVTNEAGSAPASDAAELILKSLSAQWTLDEADFVAGQYLDAAGGHHATIAGSAVTFVEGMDGTPNGAVVIDPNSWANAGTWNPSAKTNQFSVSMWMRWQGITGGHHRPITKRGIDWSTSMWGLQINPDTANIEFRSNATGGPVGALAATDFGRWQHVCATFDGVLGAMYIDGKLIQSRSLNLTTAPDSPIILGAGAADGTLAFNGVLDDIRIYNYALSAEEAADLWYEVTEQPVCVNPPDAAFDRNGDCVVNLADFAIFAGHWLECGLYPMHECP
ncbi:MAG: immunoglobulin domain-containing protein [Phycisphaerae bacterium]|nr:immunoglobulin domain-containing protein [Phycisphaerae bacterium]